MRFAKRLRSARESVGLSQYAAAKLAGVPQQTWNRWEAGEVPKADRLPNILKALAPPSRRFKVLRFLLELDT